MHTFLHRYELDSSAPTRKEAWRDFAVRVLLPAVGLWVVVVGIGLLITGPLDNLPGEAGSTAGSSPSAPGAQLGHRGALGHRHHRVHHRRVRAVRRPVLVAHQAVVARRRPPAANRRAGPGVHDRRLVVGRERPEVEHLDDSPPTSAYPSGHTGASTAFYVTLAAMAQRIGNPVLRGVVTVLCLLVPLCVGTARLYRGMHSLTDVLMGFANGLVCAFLAWNYLRRDTSSAATGTPSTDRSLSHR